MKAIVNIARVLVGLLFIFSGLVKAIDPLGLSYKMQEFFEAWQAGGFMPGLMTSLHGYSLPFALIMITLEVAAGVALLVGFRIKLTSWLLLLLMLFFTFLTAYVLFSGKIAACGCFGDCIPITPKQTFTKDIILLALVIVVLIFRKHIKPLFSGTGNTSIVLLAILGTLFLQWRVLNHLPTVDCLPFKKGNNILELRKVPKDAIPDKIEMVFIYERNGEKKEFKNTKGLSDSGWKYVDRKDVVVEAGKNNKPLINDFTLMGISGEDSTEAVLSQTKLYYLIFVKKADKISDKWLDEFATFKNSHPTESFYIVASEANKINTLFNSGKHQLNIPVFTCDATAIKTAARTDVTVYLMNGPVVQNKWSGEDLNSINN